MLNPFAEAYLGSQQQSAKSDDWPKDAGRYLADRCMCGDRTPVQIRRSLTGGWTGERKCRFCGFCCEIEYGGDLQVSGVSMTSELRHARQRYEMALFDWLKRTGKKVTFNPDGSLTPSVHELRRPSWPVFFIRKWLKLHSAPMKDYPGALELCGYDSKVLH